MLRDLDDYTRELIESARPPTPEEAQRLRRLLPPVDLDDDDDGRYDDAA